MWLPALEKTTRTSAFRRGSRAPLNRPRGRTSPFRRGHRRSPSAELRLGHLQLRPGPHPAGLVGDCADIRATAAICSTTPDSGKTGPLQAGCQLSGGFSSLLLSLPSPEGSH
ncbi:hypothetical protein SKAU_G00402850 [Synaphobranchus kaupii]|uniref:Uncharacterized protein n=1 Tax=Synaphobranchus kaupii TaxID=118154 RepID=A0A9Q1E9E3_SYNKA|nr:hypothetical protein SKAU_G00402850 [Synaphobranchus kaupii]